MWMSECERQSLVDMLSKKFRCFGGGNTSEYNPITAALKDRPPMFAAGVDVREVVDAIANAIEP